METNQPADSSTTALTANVIPEVIAQQRAMLSRVTPSGVVAFMTTFDHVLMFHAAALGKGASHIGKLNQNPPQEVIEGRLKIIKEEVNEELIPLLEKIAANGGATLEQKAELLDHFIDSVYVILGGAINFGMYFDVGFGIVHEANMAKVIRPEGPQFNEYGKVLKPEGWTPPNTKLFELCMATFRDAEKQANPLKANNLPEGAKDAQADVTPTVTAVALDEQQKQPLQ